MTLVEVTYELQAPLTPAQTERLAEFANTYGLRRFHVDGSGRMVTFEYDASRLRETQVAHALGASKIAILRRVESPIVA